MREKFYYVGGTLPLNAPSYIKREADSQLYFSLKRGDYCYVLNARQIGKSSLLIHTSKILEQEGIITINIDLTIMGTEDITAQKWYFSLLYKIIDKLNIDEELFISWWEQHKNLTLVNRFALCFDEIILNHTDKKIVIFIDEIDSLLAIKHWFSVSDFFALIRAFYNLRSSDSRYNNLTFTLLGVARAEDLIQDSARTPFNIAKDITIEPFKLKEALPLLDGLSNQQVPKKQILEEVFNWTGGIPYLTQKLLDYINQNPIKNIKEIDKIVDKLFIQTNFKETNLGYIQKMIMSNEKYNIRMLYLLEKLIKNGSLHRGKTNQQHYLKLSGLIKEENGYIKYSCKIYQKVFDIFWIEESIQKIDRPITADLIRWKKLNKTDDALLTGEVLEKVNEWALKRDDLSSDENEFLRLSTIKNQKEIKRKTKIKRIMSLLIIMGIFTAGLWYEYVELKQTKQLLTENIEIIEKQKETLEENRKILNQKIITIKNQEKLLGKNLQGTEEIYNTKIKEYEKSSKKDSLKYKLKMAKIYDELSTIYDVQGKSKKTIENIIKELKIYNSLNPNKYKKEKAKAYYHLANVYFDKPNFFKAEEYYKKALELYENLKKDKFKAKIFHSLAIIKLQQKNKDEAEKYLKNSIELYKKLSKNNPKEYLSSLAYIEEELGDLYKSKKERKLAIMYYNRAKEIFMENSSNKDEVSRLILKMKINTLNMKKGWVYLGEYADNKWLKRNFSFNKYTTPKKLINTYQIPTITLNMRTEAYFGNIIGRLDRGKKVKIIKILNLGNYQWGYIEY